MAAAMTLALERLSTHAMGSEWDSKRHIGVGGKGLEGFSDVVRFRTSSHEKSLGYAEVSGLEWGIARWGGVEHTKGAGRQETLLRLFLNDGGGLVGVTAANGEEDRWIHLEHDQVGRMWQGQWPSPITL